MSFLALPTTCCAQDRQSSRIAAMKSVQQGEFTCSGQTRDICHNSCIEMCVRSRSMTSGSKLQKDESAEHKLFDQVIAQNADFDHRAFQIYQCRGVIRSVYGHDQLLLLRMTVCIHKSVLVQRLLSHAGTRDVRETLGTCRRRCACPCATSGDLSRTLVHFPCRRLLGHSKAWQLC